MMAVASSFNARNADAYEQSMGRWSRRLAVGFTRFAGLAPGERVLDVGCGTGSLLFHLADQPERPELAGIDASPIYVAAAQARAAGKNITVQEGDALALPFADNTFDRVMTQLVLQFIKDSTKALGEMIRVCKPGGTVAAAVWASGGGQMPQRMFLDTAAMLDPAADALRADTFTRPMTRRGELSSLFQAAGLQNVVEDSVTIWMEFANFADYWDPMVAGEGTNGRYVSALDDAAREKLGWHLRLAYESGDRDGPRAFTATASVCRGTRPV